MTDNKPLGLKHHNLGPSRIRKDELAMQSLVDLMDKEWINPFGSDPMELTSLSTGTAVPPNVASDLLKANEIGEKAYKEFHNDRIKSREKCFHDTLSKQKLKTFSNVNKSSVTKGKNKETVLKADHNLFGHMVLIATSRKLDMRAVLEHPLGPLPWSLGNSDRTLKKTSKAFLTWQLERNVSFSDEIPQPSTCIIDGMALYRRLIGKAKRLWNFQSQFWYLLFVQHLTVIGLMLFLTYIVVHQSKMPSVFTVDPRAVFALPTL